MKPLLSIIIPTLNEESVLEKTLKNLRELTDIPCEIIVSDGRSRDQTIEIAKKYADKIIVYEDSRRQTIAMARNMGAKQAVGEFLLFLDADMHIPDPNNFFTKALAYFQSSQDLVALTVSLRIMPESATCADTIILGGFNGLISFYNNVLHYGASAGEFQMMCRSAFDKVGGFNESLVAGEDFDMFARLSKIGRTRSVLSLVAFHTGRRIHKVGWPKLLSQWFMNWSHATFSTSAKSEIWEEVR